PIAVLVKKTSRVMPLLFYDSRIMHHAIADSRIVLPAGLFVPYSDLHKHEIRTKNGAEPNTAAGSTPQHNTEATWRKKERPGPLQLISTEPLLKSSRKCSSSC
ncbi:unnamed protein product, partial [Ectocarpus sp. 4 AP-2014]